MAKTGRDSVQQMLRLPEDLRDRIKLESEANNRSMNAEIVARLEAFDDQVKAKRLRDFFSEGRKRHNQKLARENSILKARLARLYEEGGPDFISRPETKVPEDVLAKLIADKVNAAVSEQLLEYRSKLDRLESAVAEQLGVSLSFDIENDE